MDLLVVSCRRELLRDLIFLRSDFRACCVGTSLTRIRLDWLARSLNFNITCTFAHGLASRSASSVLKHSEMYSILTPTSTMASATGTGWAQLRQQARSLETQVMILQFF